MLSVNVFFVKFTACVGVTPELKSKGLTLGLINVRVSLEFVGD